MAKYTVDISDDVTADALAAATRINQRQPERDRQPEPLTFTDSDAADIIFAWLRGLIVQDAQQDAQLANERAIARLQKELDARRSPKPRP